MGTRFVEVGTLRGLSAKKSSNCAKQTEQWGPTETAIFVTVTRAAASTTPGFIPRPLFDSSDTGPRLPMDCCFAVLAVGNATLYAEILRFEVVERNWIGSIQS